ncbi:cytoskeletal protein CcmA (bactofilin family) [Caldicoprobacter guelmensis]|uniref:bactofilin family protein n=1 Tax=Caldicoprobacter guelmensis TaxID=1170224 RepID=UPI001956DA66|nr:polymer-forming cytoskeletal protein [Caldicoprobacter guelmensis]MBM7581863.1 cytoskeletal protein CcmA (bactofilin family) [Caldicoprobacter guelmensis]
MISKKKDKEVDTIIGKGTTVDGDIRSDRSIHVDGKVKGNLCVEGDVVVGREASITGDITANNVYISGVVEGNVYCSGFLRIFSEGVLKGDAKARSFAVDEGAFFDGKISMSQGEKAKDDYGVAKEGQQSNT